MAVYFSSNDEDVIDRKVELKAEGHEEILDLRDFFEIDRCITWIKTNDFKQVSLQFPDGLLKYSSKVFQAIQKEVVADLSVLGDTSYGSCCVAEIDAAHICADAIIHFGHACLSPTNRLPVLYVYGKFSIDIENAISEFRNLFQDYDTHIIVLCDPVYVHSMAELEKKLKDYKNLVFAGNHVRSNVDEEDISDEDNENIVKCNRRISIPKANSLLSYSIFYIGSEEKVLMDLMLSFRSNTFYSYDPTKRAGKRETLQINRYLGKRYYLIEKAKDSKIVGILVGTLVVSKYESAIDRIRDLCRQTGKKSYVIAVGKLNVAKLANFPAIDVFVYVTCPLSTVVDSREFYRPIITPFEMEIACNQAREWTGEYITDFSQLLPGASAHVPLTSTPMETGDVSLITGKLRCLGHESDDLSSEPNDNAVSIRNNMTVAEIHVGAGGEFLANSTWRGVELHLGETPVSKASQGQKGIACFYEDERPENKKT